MQSITQKVIYSSLHVLDPDGVITTDFATFINGAPAGGVGRAGDQIAQVEAERESERTPGYDADLKDALEGFDDFINFFFGNKELVDAFAADARQEHMVTDYINSIKAGDTPIVQPKSQAYLVAPDSIAPVGTGYTWKSQNEIWYVDRNGDAVPDIEIFYPKDSNASPLVNYGDGNGFKPYDAKTYLPPPPEPPLVYPRPESKR